MKYPIILLFLFFSLPSLGQTIVSGTLMDENMQPIDNVSVSYKKINAVAPLGFTKSENGSFKLQLKVNETDSIQLIFNHLSYAQKTVVIPVKTASYRFTLAKGERWLKEVKVGNVPVFKRKDTINYNVEAFSGKEDRVIADIIKKLPGIEIEGGRILYQGRPIQKYMVNNLDLMEGRYGMINNNLPANAVKNVQIVENDQPIKILDSLLFSDRASLNLELKKFTSTGTGKIGMGAQPMLWDVGVTPMTFGKTFQMLNSVQSNNIGYDAAKDLRAFYTGGTFFGSQADMGDGPSYISLRDLNSPEFDEKKWLDNKLFLFNTNVLQKLKNGLELKGNVSYYDDTRKRQGFTSTRYYTSDEILVNSERIDNRFRTNVLDAGLLVEKNEKKIYLRNTFKYHKRWNSDLGNLVFNQDTPIEQRSAYTDESLMNSLSLARFLGRQLVNISSTIEWHNTPQRLLVSPGQFEDILNNGMSYEQMKQSVHYKGLQWNNSLNFVRKLGNWRLSPNIALNYDRNILDSDISIEEDHSEKMLSDNYQNAVKNSQMQLSLNLGLFWENRRWKFNLSAPYGINYFNSEQKNVKTLSNVLRNTFQPSASLIHLMNSKNEWSVAVSGRNHYGKLNNFYDAYIISQYRSMQRYDTKVLGSSDLKTSVSYRYKNTLKANFANVDYSYSRESRDYIFASHLDSLGRVNTGILDRNSLNESHSLNAGLSRFFANIKTVMKVNARTNWTQMDYLLNEVMARQRMFNLGGTLEVINNFSSVISGEYKAAFGHSMNRLAEGRENNIIYNNHFLNVMFTPLAQHTVILKSSLYNNNIPEQSAQYFFDGTYRYHINKWKTDIELSINNLLNNNRYAQQYSTDYQLIQTYFELRPRQILVSTSFRF